MMAGGGSVYTMGTAIDEVGAFMKYASSKNAGAWAADALSIPLMGIKNPLVKAGSDQTKSYFADKSGFGDPCAD
jgi:hypothetical protein